MVFVEPPDFTSLLMSGVASGGVSTSFPPIPSASIATSAVSEVVRVKEIPDDNSCLFHAVG